LDASARPWHRAPVHHHDISRWQHHHRFLEDRSAAEKSTRRVTVLCAIVMVVEIVAGAFLNSMAVVADGFHMATHVAAFLIAAVAYAWSRRYENDPRFSFGTGKIGVLGGFTSAIVLGLVAVLITYESVTRLFRPLPIQFTEAIGVAVLGLTVNAASALLLRNNTLHPCGHNHDHGHRHGAHGHDLNLRAAYIHVLADAATSMLAIVALLAGKFLGWTWLDPAMGLIGAGLVAQWAFWLARDTGTILLDRTPETDLVDEIRKAVEADGDSVITDLHVWCLGEGRFTAIVSVLAAEPRTPEDYKARFRRHGELVHVTVEVNRCVTHGHPTLT
jgi:cation diffusion facilitator family transporter